MVFQEEPCHSEVQKQKKPEKFGQSKSAIILEIKNAHYFESTILVNNLLRIYVTSFLNDRDKNGHI